MKAYSHISIIIAAYNEEKSIGNVLEKLTNQLKIGDEIIVVDNNSTDKTAAIAKQFNVRLVSEKHQGLSFARNTGFEIAKNEIIARTDADTLVCDTWFEVIRSYYSGETDQRKFDAITGPVYVKEFLPIRYGVHQGFTKKALGHETLVGSNEAITKDLWNNIENKLSNDDQNYMEDMEMSSVIKKSGGNVIFLPQMIVFTSGRWMIRHPLRSLGTWKRKFNSTKQLINSQ